MDLRRHQIDEAELLAFIEREPMPAARAEAVARAVQSDAALAELVAAMRADREVLGTLGQVRAPSTLLESVEARLEREALLGLSRTDAPMELPVSRVVPRRQPAVIAVLSRPWARQLAMAAGLALALGVGFLVLKANWPQPKVRETAFNGPSERNAEIVRTVPDKTVVRGATKNENAGTGASAAEPTAARDAALAKAAEGGTAPKVDPPAADEPAVATMTVERAMELARQGRLAVRVRAGTVETGYAKLTSLRSRAGAWLTLDRGVAAEDGTLTETLRVAILAQRTPAVAPAHPSPNPATASSGAPGAPRIEPRPVPAVPAPTVHLGGETYRLSLAGDDEHLRSLLHRLCGGDKDLLMHLHELPAALPLTPPADLDAMLWWNRAPMHWERRVVLPVVIELP